MTVLAPAHISARILVIGRSAETLEMVLQELRDAGLDATGTADPEGAASHDARDYDLIALGRGLLGPPGDRLRDAFKRRNPSIRLLDVHAPTAAHQIMAALDADAGRPPVDLSAYCERIGYSGALMPTLETLRALQERHIAAIPFEAIDVILDRGVDLAPAAVDAKLIGRRRGGYCFEQNGLFRRVLLAIGFDVEGLIARVRWMAPPGSAPRPLTHMALRVTIDGTPWLADVGFGGNVPPAPLRMDRHVPQETRHGAFRLIPLGSGLVLQALLGDRWEPLYELHPHPAADADYEAGNWFTATHPSSHFRHRLTAARTGADARYSLLEGRLTIRRPDQAAQQEWLDADGIADALESIFGLTVEDEWRPALERAANAPRD
jgi:N-hydroxyarylamine O-acetyltransferase